MVDFRNVLVFSDQPVTCPRCGARTDIILDLSHTKNEAQIHQCLAEGCSSVFVVEKDEG